MNGAALFDLDGQKPYDLKGVNIYRLSGELVGHLNGAQGSDRRLDRSTDKLFPVRGSRRHLIARVVGDGGQHGYGTLDLISVGLIAFGAWIVADATSGSDSLLVWALLGLLTVVMLDKPLSGNSRRQNVGAPGRIIDVGMEATGAGRRADLPGRPEAIRRLVKLGLKAKGK